MPDLHLALIDLCGAIGNYHDRSRTDGVFHLQIGGPGSVPALKALDMPELHVDLLPGPITSTQVDVLRSLGYVPAGLHWQHPGGWRLVLPDEASGWRAGQQALRALLLDSPEAAAAYVQVFGSHGRDTADLAFQERASAHYACTVGFHPACFVARMFAGLDLPWMFAGGVALDLYMGRVTRPHDDLDVIVPYDQQAELHDHLQQSGWRLDASVNRTYQPWVPPLEPPSFQVHARHPDLPDVVMLDLMLTDLSGGRWRYRRDPNITLPLERARLQGPHGLPYLTPEAALLFKAGRGEGGMRLKDARDFARLRPSLTAGQQRWLHSQLKSSQPDHPWLPQLNGSI
ncbi:hypothetical protein DEDE109153_08960 [Deinococcus deserti]|uniref:Aminoglycoside-2''-adenylyltransferase n=1 Tax=Deinococcus deserti (strain DSM 17065 / CIP 109153 / LMG 22923 / VCD115) TaxID=546414 RepID=C1D426_DEIDV|nr:hypothetical protein [Deinococcus deserti]ACO47907.1 hypothetical protein Deide_3p00052 [Deinococcus deserti VCD115]